MIIGAVAGDIIGSIYEFHNVKSTQFDLFTPKTTFTDHSVLTVATMEVLLKKGDYTETYKRYGKNYKNRGYGNRFHYWIYEEKSEPYNSYGNGSAMRVSPIGWYGANLSEVLAEAKRSAEVSHNHVEGIKGAQAAAAAVYLARNGESKTAIKNYISETFHYNLEQTTDEIRIDYSFDESCQGTVPQAITAFLESGSFENAVRLAISIGGDSDTIACITAAIAEAYYLEIPDFIRENVVKILPPEFTEVIEAFSEKYGMNLLSIKPA